MIGFDLVKEINLIEPAYNDKAGFTSKFNLNLLNRINKELNGNFEIKNFDHHAFYNTEENRIEMHLRSKSNQSIDIPGIEETFHIMAGETIHTENSYKYDKAKIEKFSSKGSRKNHS